MVEVDTCSHRVGMVGRNNIADPEGVVEHFFQPGVVHRGHLCHPAVPAVAVCVPASVCPGSLISSFSAYVRYHVPKFVPNN